MATGRRPFSSSKPELRVSVLGAQLPAGPLAARERQRKVGPVPQVTAPKSRRNTRKFQTAVWDTVCSSETLTGQSRWSRGPGAAPGRSGEGAGGAGGAGGGRVRDRREESHAAWRLLTRSSPT